MGHGPPEVVEDRENMENFQLDETLRGCCLG